MMNIATQLPPNLKLFITSFHGSELSWQTQEYVNVRHCRGAGNKPPCYYSKEWRGKGPSGRVAAAHDSILFGDGGMFGHEPITTGFVLDSTLANQMPWSSVKAQSPKADLDGCIP